MQRVATFTLQTLVLILAATGAMGMYFWITVYFVDQGDKTLGGTPLTLAPVLAIFGGFGLAGGFTRFGTPELRGRLRLTAVFHLVSSLCLFTLGVLHPLLVRLDGPVTLPGYVLVAVVLMAVVGAATTFGLGTVVWAALIGDLIATEDDSGQPGAATQP